MFWKTKREFGGGIAKQAILLVSQPYTYKYDRNKLKEAHDFVKSMKKKGVLVVLVYEKETQNREDSGKEEKILAMFEKQADYLFRTTAAKFMLEHAPTGNPFEPEKFGQYYDFLKKIAELLEDISTLNKRSILMVIGGYDSHCVRGYTKYFFFERKKINPFECFLVLPSLIIPFTEEDEPAPSKDEIIDSWCKGPPDQTNLKHREIPRTNVLVLKNYKRLL